MASAHNWLGMPAEVAIGELNTLPFGFAVLLPSLCFLYTGFKGTVEARFHP